MAAKTFGDILKDLRSNTYQPIYVLHGNESYFLDQLSDRIESEVLAEHEKAFNQTIVYGRDCQLSTLVDALKRYPMMAERQVVILKEAQEFKDLKKLESYVKNPAMETVFCIVHKYKSIDSRTSFGKLLKSSPSVAFFQSKQLYDNEVPGWIEDFVNGHGFQIYPEVSAMIAENIGNNLTLIHNELKKLFFNLSENDTITADHIEKYVGISKTYNVFELTDAFANRNHEKIFKIYENFASNIKNTPPVVVISTLFQYFFKTYCLAKSSNAPDMELAKKIGLKPRNHRSAEFLLKRFKLGVRHYSIKQLEQIFQLLQDYDLKSKGVDSGKMSPEQLLLELFSRILLVR